MLIALVGASLLFAGACSGDDDDSASTGDQGNSLGSGDEGDGGADLGSADGYTDEIEQSFLSQCVPAAAGAPDPDGMCQCAWDKITETVSFEDFKAYDEELRENPAAEPPAGLMEATTSCATEQVTTP
jgi:hypothetical protein